MRPGWAASPGAGLLLPTAQLWAWGHLSAEPETGTVQRAAGKWALASSPLRADPPTPPASPGLEPSSALPAFALAPAQLPCLPALALALTEVGVIVGAEVESCACSSRRDAGPVGEQGAHQVHVLVQDGHVQCGLTWFRDGSQSWGLSLGSRRGPQTYSWSHTRSAPGAGGQGAPSLAGFPGDPAAAHSSHALGLSVSGARCSNDAHGDHQAERRWIGEERTGRLRFPLVSPIYPTEIFSRSPLPSAPHPHTAQTSWAP